MNITKTAVSIFFAAIMLIFSACSNPANDFNEHMALNFLDVMNNVDTIHTQLLEQNESAKRLTADKLQQKMASLDEHILAVKNYEQSVNNGVEAEAFRAQVLHYMGEVKTLYYPALKQYIAAGENQVTSAENLNAIRNELTVEENKTLEIQKRFLTKADIAY